MPRKLWTKYCPPCEPNRVKIVFMETEVLEKGQVVIPASLLRRLGIKPGDRLKADIKDETIILSSRPVQKKASKARIIKDPITGLPVIDVGEDAPILTSEMVREMLADFP